MFKRVMAGVAALVASLVMCAVAETQADATCGNPTYGSVWCNPGHPAPSPVRHRPQLAIRR